MVIVSCLYLAVVYLVFFKWKLLPFNKITGGIVVVLGVMILTVFLVGLQTLTPQSTQGMITGSVTEIAPQVSGRVIEVPVKAFQRVEPGDTLFKIDPRPYQYRVDQLTAQLVETEAYVAQLKETYDADKDDHEQVSVAVNMMDRAGEQVAAVSTAIWRLRNA